MYSRETEIRHISSTDVYKLGQILEQTRSWKKLMRAIPKKMTTNLSNGSAKYNNDHVRLIENASFKQNRMATEILFEEWGTSGRKRPTIGNLLELLIKVQLFRAADYVALNFLNESQPERPLNGPAAKVDITLPLLSCEIREVEEILEDVSYPRTTDLVRNELTNQNNKDFYTKLNINAVKVDIEETDLMKFSTISITTTDNIPDLSELVNNNVIVEATNQEILFETSNYEQQSTNYIPALSTLHVDISEDSLPNLSVLNNIIPEVTDSRNNTTNFISNSSMEDSNLAPNLSILDQIDTKLKSITVISARTDENDSSENHSTTEDDILPCLSAFNK